MTVGPTTASSANPTHDSVVIGIKVDQFGTGYLDVATYKYSGMDHDVAQMLAVELFSDVTPYFLPVSSDSREPALDSRAVRFFVATYTMNDERARKFALAGPYLITHQGVMVSSTSQISGTADLNGRRVCVVGRGSLSEKVLKEYVPGAIPVPEDSYSACLNEVRAGKNVDAFSTDQAILYGYASKENDVRVLDGTAIGPDINYGVAFRWEDAELCRKARDAIKKMLLSGSWSQNVLSELATYVKAIPDYQTKLKPTLDEVDQDSCHKPAG